jgi:peptidoglycan hydrolase CwlO-like protein
MKINDLESYNRQRDQLLEKVELLDEKIEKIEEEIANLRKKVPNHVGGTRRRRRA